MADSYPEVFVDEARLAAMLKFLDEFVGPPLPLEMLSTTPATQVDAKKY